MSENNNEEAKIYDFMSKREEKIESKKRNFERVLFSNLLGAYTVIDHNGTIYPVSLINISKSGCSLETAFDGRSTPLDNESEIDLRIYFTKTSFLPAILKVKRSEVITNHDGYKHIQYGCEFDTTLPSFVAMRSFIEFMYKFSEYSSVDNGNQQAYFIK